LTWKIEFKKSAYKELQKLSGDAQIRIIAFLENDLASTKKPDDLGKKLKGKFSDYYRFRVGKYRIITQIENNIMIITVISVGKREDVYKKMGYK